MIPFLASFVNLVEGEYQAQDVLEFEFRSLSQPHELQQQAHSPQ
jgi:hypothetical protein